LGCDLEIVLGIIADFLIHVIMLESKRNIMTTSTILLHIFLASASISYFIYGKTQRKAVALFAGIGLGIVPYLTLEIWQLILLSGFLMLVPFLVKI